ncbi:nudix hydrolase 20 [Roridomyces roridus]|uniref:Nudix hydrolase 20 n=1 Tax=Roridomyces roridus TaxID=1738132 RepID=A0AAD7FJ37_9AGAR|nr:nudix hydrolase 20 [Roridomyces roridus]
MQSDNLNLSYLELVNACGNARINPRHAPLAPTEFDAEHLVPFTLSDAPTSPIVGLLRPQIVELLSTDNYASESKGITPTWAGASTIPGLTRRVSFAGHITTHQARSAAMRELCERWSREGVFADIIGPKKWRGELYAVYRDPFGVHDYPGDGGQGDGLNFAFEMERAACALFGIITYGVHMSMYQEKEDGELRVWVPTRSKTKSMWPGYLDNTVAGGIPSGMPIFEAMVKECAEEAKLDEALCRTHIRAVGCISYCHRTDKGWLQPEVEYLYDLRIPPNADPAASPFKPEVLDGEVQSFELMDRSEIEKAMRAGRFKANCVLVLIDLFIRLGLVTPDNEPDYLKIVTGMHTRFDYERW